MYHPPPAVVPILFRFTKKEGYFCSHLQSIIFTGQPTTADAFPLPISLKANRDDRLRNTFTSFCYLLFAICYLLTANRWRLVAGGWWLVAGGWWLVAGGWWLVAGGWWLKNKAPCFRKELCFLLFNSIKCCIQLKKLFFCEVKICRAHKIQKTENSEAAHHLHHRSAHHFCTHIAHH